MRRLTIPIRADGAMPGAPDGGDEEALSFLPLPREMRTFEMPRLPDPGAGGDVAGAARVLGAFVDAMGHWLDGPAATPAGDGPEIDLAALPAAVRRAVDECLGEGEVSAIVRPAGAGTGGDADGLHGWHMQETVFAGVWRVQPDRAAPGGSAAAPAVDRLLAAPIPARVAGQARLLAAARLPQPPLPPGAMNVRPLLAELQEAMERCAPGQAAHVVNLTLLPLSADDTAHLDAVLGAGAVTILSRGFGNCRIDATGARDVWRVRYFNNMNTLLLDTLEVVAIPEAALAAADDLRESHARLAELVVWLHGEGDGAGV